MDALVTGQKKKNHHVLDSWKKHKLFSGFMMILRMYGPLAVFTAEEDAKDEEKEEKEADVVVESSFANAAMPDLSATR